MRERPYSKVYHELADEYPEVYDGPDLAAYVRLLVAADQAWPTAARWAGYATRPEVQRLSDAGLVLIDANRFRIKGLDKERTARSNAASNAARRRWGNANGTAQTMPSKAKQSRAEQSSSSGQSDGQDAADEYYRLKGGQVSAGALSFIDELVRDFGDEAVAREMGAEAGRSALDREFLSRVRSGLLLRGRREVKEAEERRKRRAVDELAEMERRAAEQTPEQRARIEELKAEAVRSIRSMP